MNIRLDKLPREKWRFRMKSWLPKQIAENLLKRILRSGKRNRRPPCGKPIHPRQPVRETKDTYHLFSPGKEQKAKTGKPDCQNREEQVAKERIGKSLRASAKANNSGARVSKGPWTIRRKSRPTRRRWRQTVRRQPFQFRWRKPRSNRPAWRNTQIGSLGRR